MIAQTTIKMINRLTRPAMENFPAVQIAKNPELMERVREAIRAIQTTHRLHNRDARDLREQAHLVVTSPPYWTLKEYNTSEGQMGHIEDYEEFLDALDKVWRACFEALVPGGRLICVVGDVCLSRKKHGRHQVVPLHSSIQERWRKLGIDNLAPIIWHKIANVTYEMGGGGCLGKPYEPNGVIKNDIEFILMGRKPGYRDPGDARLLSVISEEDYKAWFRQIWTMGGASTRDHPAPYPVALAQRLIQMFSFVGDTVLDPFLGSGTTSVAAASCGRNSIGYEIDPDYFAMARNRLEVLLANPDR